VGSLILYPLRFLAWLAGILWFAVAGGMLTLLAGTLASLLPARGRDLKMRRFIGACFRGVMRWGQWTGVFRLDLWELAALQNRRGLLLAPNHPMLIDALLILGVLPETTCIMKAAIWDSPCLGGGARLAGYIRNDSASGMVKQAVAELQQGRNILIFPEGTRTLPGRVLNDFKSGFALIAKKSGCPVQLLCVECSVPYLGKQWPLYRPPPFPLEVRVRPGPCVRVGSGEKTRDAVHRLESLLARELSAAQ
jgi:1-acyl-sn-glycerol-3-phosphate acyltransferase